MTVLRWIGSAGLMAVSVAAACGGGSPTTPSPTCITSLSPTTAAYEAVGGSGSIAITTSAGCPWTATIGADWLAFTGAATGSGSGTVSYAVGANPSATSRTGGVSVAGQVHAVSQQGRTEPCRFELSPSSVRTGKDAVTGSFAVVAADQCAWTASSAAAWLAVVGGTTGSGAGTVTYEIARNPGLAERRAVITVADRDFVVVQGGDVGVCTYRVTPVTVNACMPGGSFTSTIDTGPGCPWTAAVDASWLTVASGTSGLGPGTIAVEFGANYDAPRVARVLVRWPTPTEGQNIQFAQAGCRYAANPTALAVAATGGNGRFDVFQQSDPIECGGALQDRCVWSAETAEPWVTILTVGPRSGDGSVAFTVAPNPSASTRTAIIVVRDVTVRVTQAGS